MPPQRSAVKRKSSGEASAIQNGPATCGDTSARSVEIGEADAEPQHASARRAATRESPSAQGEMRTHACLQRAASRAADPRAAATPRRTSALRRPACARATGHAPPRARLPAHRPPPSARRPVRGRRSRPRAGALEPCPQRHRHDRGRQHEAVSGSRRQAGRRQRRLGDDRGHAPIRESPESLTGFTRTSRRPSGALREKQRVGTGDPGNRERTRAARPTRSGAPRGRRR